MGGSHTAGMTRSGQRRFKPLVSQGAATGVMHAKHDADVSNRVERCWYTKNDVRKLPRRPVSVENYLNAEIGFIEVIQTKSPYRI